VCVYVHVCVCVCCQVYKDDRPPVVVEIDDETDADMIAALHDWSAPIGIDMVNIGVSSPLLHSDCRLLLSLFYCLCVTHSLTSTAFPSIPSLSSH
jgi:hypothetical protein